MEWQINRSAKSCIYCNKGFNEEEEYFSALYDKDDVFTRRDFCIECWSRTKDEERFSYWKTKVQKKPEKIQRYANIDIFYDLFLRTENENNLSSVNFRYVLSLYLMRKKILKLKTINKSNGEETLVFQNLKEDKETKVSNPQLGKDEITAVTEEIGKLVDCKPQV